jgi:hypothetical protein
MKASRPERKNKVEMVRRETNTVIKKIYRFGCNGPKLYILMEFNSKYSIFDSCPDKNWRLSDEALVLLLCLLSMYSLTANRNGVIHFEKELIRRKSVEE